MLSAVLAWVFPTRWSLKEIYTKAKWTGKINNLYIFTNVTMEWWAITTVASLRYGPPPSDYVIVTVCNVTWDWLVQQSARHYVNSGWTSDSAVGWNLFSGGVHSLFVASFIISDVTPCRRCHRNCRHAYMYSTDYTTYRFKTVTNYTIYAYISYTPRNLSRFGLYFSDNF